MLYNRSTAHMCGCYVIQTHWPIEDGADPQLLYVSNKKQLHVGGVQWILSSLHTAKEFHCVFLFYAKYESKLNITQVECP